MGRENAGALQYARVVVDLSALTNAASEPVDLAAETGIDDPAGAHVAGASQAGTYSYQWDHSAGAVSVVGHDGTDPGSGTDAGEAVLIVWGRR